VITLADAEVRINTDLNLVVGASVSGNVTEGINNIDNLYLIIGSIFGSNDFNYFVVVNTDPSGNYTASGLPLGDYYVRATDAADDYIDAMWSSAGTVQCSRCIADVDSTLSLVAAEVRLGVDFCTNRTNH